MVAEGFRPPKQFVFISARPRFPHLRLADLHFPHGPFNTKYPRITSSAYSLYYIIHNHSFKSPLSFPSKFFLPAQSDQPVTHYRRYIHSVKSVISSLTSPDRSPPYASHREYHLRKNHRGYISNLDFSTHSFDKIIAIRNTGCGVHATYSIGLIPSRMQHPATSRV